MAMEPENATRPRKRRHRHGRQRGSGLILAMFHYLQPVFGEKTVGTLPSGASKGDQLIALGKGSLLASKKMREAIRRGN